MTQMPDPLDYDAATRNPRESMAFFKANLIEWLAPLNPDERTIPYLKDSPLTPYLLGGKTVVVRFTRSPAGITALLAHLKSALICWAVTHFDKTKRASDFQTWTKMNPSQILRYVFGEDKPWDPDHDDNGKWKIEDGPFLIIDAMAFPASAKAQNHFSILMQQRYSARRATFFCTPYPADICGPGADPAFEDFFNDRDLIPEIEIPERLPAKLVGRKPRG